MNGISRDASIGDHNGVCDSLFRPTSHEMGQLNGERIHGRRSGRRQVGCPPPRAEGERGRGSVDALRQRPPTANSSGCQATTSVRCCHPN